MFHYVKNIFDVHILGKETVALLNFVEICTEMHFVSYIFSKWMKHYNLPFGDTFKIYCCALF